MSRGFSPFNFHLTRRAMNGRTSTAGSGDATETDSAASLFDEVIERHTGLISRIALAHELDAALRRDLVQDIMLAIWGSLPSFRGDSSLKTFVAGIAYKRCFTHLARATRQRRS